MIQKMANEQTCEEYDAPHGCHIILDSLQLKCNHSEYEPYIRYDASGKFFMSIKTQVVFKKSVQYLRLSAPLERS